MKKVHRLPLEGVRVTEFTTAWAGPGCGMALSEMGAEVIKIENPKLPDYWRRTCPSYSRGEGPNRSGLFAIVNRGKKSCVLDLKSSEGLEAAKKLVSISDIVIENYAPRVLESLGLDYSVLKEIKPDIIMVSESGYGATGPDKDCLAYGLVLEAYAGLSSMLGNGKKAELCGMPISDHIAAIMAAFAALSALHYRDLTGEGQHIDLSEVETMLSMMPETIMEYTMNGTVPVPSDNKDDFMAPHGCYVCQGEDKWVAIAVGGDVEWKNLCKVMGKPEIATDKRFRDAFSRQTNQNELNDIITEWTREQTPADIVEKLQKMGIASGPVYNAEELYDNPHLQARKFFVKHNHPEVGIKELPGVFAKLSETPGVIKGHDPLVGEHTDWVLHELLAPKDN